MDQVRILTGSVNVPSTEMDSRRRIEVPITTLFNENP